LTEEPNESTYRKVAKEIGVDGEGMVDSVKKVKVIMERNIRAAAEVLYIIANALSKIGYEGLKLRENSKLLENEVSRTNLLLEESKKVNERMMEQFSIMSHELKTPLNIIFSSVQLLESLSRNNYDVPQNRTFLKYFSIMRQNCYRLTRLINNIIDINKIELGFFVLHLKNNDIVKLVEDITLSVVEYANLKKISIVFDTDIEEKIILCDSEKIERIVLNLLSNAIKFTEEGGFIKVGVCNGSEYIIISVKDNGIGIPQNMIEKIFYPFIQVDSSLRRNAEGSGMGLSIVKSLVEMHSGSITVKSELAVGSEFIIKIPVNTDEEQSNLDRENKSILSNLDESIKIELSDLY
jgi:signal transduction histidine kinase